MKTFLKPSQGRVAHAIAASCLLLGLTATGSQAAEGAMLARQEVTFGEPLLPSHWGQRVQPLAPGESPSPGSYRIRAEIAPRMSDGSHPDAGVALVPSGPVRTDPAGSTMELAAPAGTRLRDFSELVTENEDRRGCRAEWSAVLHPAQPGESERAVRLGGQTSHASDAAVVMAEQPGTTDWRRKDVIYLIKRELGLAFDPGWRYAEDGNFTVIQRRLEVPLRDAHTIELEFPSKTVLSGVNLSIARWPGRRARELLSGGEFSSRTEDDGTRTRVWLYLGGALADKARWGDDPYLAEIFISYQGSEADVARDRPLRSMRVLGDPQNEAGPPASIQAETWTDEASGKRLVRQRFSLKDLDEGSDGDARRFAALRLRIPPGCGTGIARARLISSQSLHAEPLFQARMRAQLEKLGGPFLNAGEGSQEWLQWLQWLPIADAQPDLRLLADSHSEAELPGWGARVRWTGDHPRVAVSREGLVATGLRSARLQWDMNTTAHRDARIYADIPQGAEYLGILDAELLLDSGAVVRFELVPNRAQLLPAGIPAGSRIRSLVVHVVAPSGTPDWTLAGLGIFRTYLAPASRLDAQPRPGWRALPQALVQRADGQRDGIYRWEARPAGMRAGDLLQVRIQHSLGAHVREKCWLTMEVTGEQGGQARIPLCPSPAEWQTGLASLLRNGSLAPDEPIRTLTWAARLTAPPSDAAFHVVLGLSARPSVRDTLRHGLALQVGSGMPPLQPSTDARGIAPSLPAPIWLDYGEWAVSSAYKPRENPWQYGDLFELRRIVWVADEALWPALEEQRKARLRQSVTSSPHPEAGLRLQSAWLIVFTAVLFLLAVPRKAPRRWPPPMPDPVKNQIRSAIGRWCLHVGSLVTLGGTGLALVWIWKGAGAGPESPWFLAAGLLALMAVCLRLSRLATGLIHSGSPLRAIVAVLWLAVLAWLLGHLGHPRHPVVYASLLLAGTMWIGIPVPSRSFLAKATAAAFRPVTLLALSSLCLYAVGLSLPTVVRKENVWITMGSLVAVVVWWHASRGLFAAAKGRAPGWMTAIQAVPGGGMFAGALAALALSCGALWFGQSTLAAHLSTLFFYMWCTGALVTACGSWARARPGADRAR